MHACGTAGDAEPAFLLRTVPRSLLPETMAFMALPIEVEGRTIGVPACQPHAPAQTGLADRLRPPPTAR